MCKFDEQAYLSELEYILHYGEDREDRTGIGTKSIFGSNLRFDLRKDFPCFTSKKIFFDGVVDELLWFLSGSTNINDLPERTRHWWSPWAKKNGDLGPIYGEQWRGLMHCSIDSLRISYTDQIKDLIKNIKKKPTDRGHVVSSWQVARLKHMALRPCHCLFQMYVTNDGYLHCQMYQRSADMFLGVPCNIASYSLLTCLVASVCNLKPGIFHWAGGDCHIYKNHFDAVEEQLKHSLGIPEHPKLVLKRKPSSLFDFKAKDIALDGYDPRPAIKAPVAV